HIEPLLILPVNAFVQLRILLNSRTRAAPECLIFGIKGLPGTRSQREVVLCVSNLRPDRTDAVIQQRALIVIKKNGGWIPAIQLSRQLQHVVSAAAFSRVYALLQFGGQTPRGCEPR